MHAMAYLKPGCGFQTRNVFHMVGNSEQLVGNSLNLFFHVLFCIDVCLVLCFRYSLIEYPWQFTDGTVYQTAFG